MGKMEEVKEEKYYELNGKGTRSDYDVRFDI